MCVHERYGNCDEETKDQKHCIFHKPEKDKKEAREFYEKFLDRFKPRVVEEVEIKRFVFGDVDCRRYVFPKIPKDFDFSFEYSVFEGAAEFEGVTFEEVVDFTEATFKSAAEFTEATFEGTADFSEKKEESEYKFYGELKFENAEFRKGVRIDIPSEWFKLPEAEAEACRVQRICYEKEGKKDDADRMFVRERRALRKKNIEEAKAEVIEAKDKGTESKLKALWNLFKAYVSSFTEWLLADLTCEYGTSWERPILVIWIPAVLFFFPALYFLTKSISNAHDLLSYLYFSIVTATTLGYGDLHPVGIGRALASAEATFGTFMWAVFLVVFARKYMR